MFDKITIRAKLSIEECYFLSQHHHLSSWTNDSETEVEYRSGDYSRFSGVEVSIKRNVLTLKTSLHKYWNRRNYDVLRNDNIFTVSEAKSAFEMLLYENRLNRSKVRIIQFEIGLNLEVSYDPITFIERVKHISIKQEKQMFNDANYHFNRQRTTEKYKDIRKYFKIYDKGWEMSEKSRKNPKPESNTHILRIETCYKRHNESAHTFFTDRNIERLVSRFYLDWKGLFFTQNVLGKNGNRLSEIERATMIVNEGSESYLQRTKCDFENGKITLNQYRTVREFVRDFEKNRNKYQIIISAQELEYKSLIYSTYNYTRT